MRLAITVTRHGTPVTVETMPADLVAWETRSGRSVTTWGNEPPTYSDVAYLAFRAFTRGAADRPTFEDWLEDGVSDLTIAEVGGAVPTGPGQSPG